VLEAMRENGINRLAFASTGSIYGESTVIPTPENAPFPIQTSLYGTSKLAAEGLIQAYCEGFNFQSYIFRFVSILGERYTHGHVFDFYKQLLKNPTELKVLGNGKQRKSYLYIQDCIDALLFATEHATDKVNIFNLGTDEYCEINDSISWICDYLKLFPTFSYSGGDRGWIGDNPFIFLDCSRIRKLGWKPKLSIREGVTQTISYLHQHPWVLEERQ
jgi:UDP-glucose 4-epimerase